MLRTATVYRASDRVNDRERVIVAVQLRDGGGNSEVLGTGLVVTLRATGGAGGATDTRSEEHTSELQSPVPTAYAVFCLKKKNIGGRGWGKRRDRKNGLNR